MLGRTRTVTDALDVYLYSRLVATIARRGDNLRLRYLPDYVKSERPAFLRRGVRADVSEVPVFGLTLHNLTEMREILRFLQYRGLLAPSACPSPRDATKECRYRVGNTIPGYV